MFSNLRHTGAHAYSKNALENYHSLKNLKKYVAMSNVNL